MTNAWEDALNRAARSVESPTYDELDETLEEQYEDLPQVFEPLDIDLAFVFLRGRLEILAYALQREAEDELRAYTPTEFAELAPAQRKTAKYARAYGASWWKTRQMVSQVIADGFRSYDEQLRLYNLWRGTHPEPAYVIPGRDRLSYHERGLAIDLEEFAGFGEPWHWEYNPYAKPSTPWRRLKHRIRRWWDRLHL